LTGIELRQKIDQARAQQKLKEQALALEGQQQQIQIQHNLATEANWAEKLKSDALDRALKADSDLTSHGIEMLKLDLEKEKEKTRTQQWNAEYGVKLLDHSMKAKELEQKIVTNNQAALKPTLERYNAAVREANVLRGKAFASPLYETSEAKESKAAARAALETKMTEINNLAAYIDKATIPVEEESLGAGKQVKENRARDARIADTTQYLTRVKTGVNVTVDTKDLNPQVAQLKRDAAVPVMQLKAKVSGQIQDIETKYYKDLETNPYAPVPTAKIEALMYGMAKKLQDLQRANKYLKVDMGNLNAVLYGGDTQ
jgi:hypothetical protein